MYSHTTKLGHTGSLFFKPYKNENLYITFVTTIHHTFVAHRPNIHFTPKKHQSYNKHTQNTNGRDTLANSQKNQQKYYIEISPYLGVLQRALHKFVAPHHIQHFSNISDEHPSYK